MSLHIRLYSYQGIKTIYIDLRYYAEPYTWLKKKTRNKIGTL